MSTQHWIPSTSEATTAKIESTTTTTIATWWFPTTTPPSYDYRYDLFWDFYQIYIEASEEKGKRQLRMESAEVCSCLSTFISHFFPLVKCLITILFLRRIFLLAE